MNSLNTMNSLFAKRLSIFASDLNCLIDRVYELEQENAELREYKAKYDQLLTDSLRHGEAMMGHLLKATINKNIVPAPENKPE